jgi:hypothetical protein
LKLQGAGPGDTTPPDTSDPSRVVLKGEPVRVLAADFAQNEGVKIAGSSDSKTVEYIDGGDWIENSFNIATTGRFEITLGLSSQSGGGSVSLALDETALEEKATFPNTGSYSQYQDTKITTTLPAGVHTLRLTFNGGQGVGNISTLQFVQLTSGIKSGGIQKVRASYKLTSKSSQLYLDLAENDVLDGEVFNAAGSHIGGFSKRAFAAGNALLPLGNKNLKPGMYFVNITSVKNGRIKMPVLVVR